jgi:hypothetical protein
MGESVHLAAKPSTSTFSAEPTAAAALSFRFGFVDGKRPAILLRLIQTANRFLCRVVVGQFDKAEAFAATRVTILDDLGAFHFAIRGKQRFQCSVIDIVAKVTDI